MSTKERLEAMDEAGARAVGMLRALLNLGTMPAIHRESAESIVAQFEGEEIKEEA